MRLYFDFISPYAYLAWRHLPELEAATSTQVKLVPVLFAALLDHHGTKGPAEIPAKRTYVFKDANRKSHALGFGPVVPPPAHPFNPLLALRLASLDFETEATRRRLIDALFRNTWSEGAGIDTEEKIRSILDALSLPVDALVDQATSAEGKARVRTQTEAAIADGVFGVPSLVVGGEVFWGLDAFPFAIERALGRDVIDGLNLDQWAKLPSGADRLRREAK